jgi:GT2 family glycosyltransferase
METLTVTILITTKDRKDELKRAVESALIQKDVDEILVFDDGSSDGTRELITSQFPSVRFERSETPLGIVGARNCAMRLAKGSVVITIDDDCVFQSADTVRDTLSYFQDRRIGAVALPHINVRSSAAVYSLAPSRDRTYVISEFCAGASALRRDLFVSMGGFNPLLWRQCEEYDFCTKMLSRGYFTQCGTTDPILHYESPSRKSESMVFHSARGHLLYAWCNVPLWALLPHAVATVTKSLAHGHGARHLKSAAMGLASAVAAVTSGRARRRPVASRVYRLVRMLRRNGPLDLLSLSPSLYELNAE